MIKKIISVITIISTVFINICVGKENLGISNEICPGELYNIHRIVELPKTQKYSSKEIDFFNNNPDDLIILFVLSDLFKKTGTKTDETIHISISTDIKKIHVEFIIKSLKKIYPHALFEISRADIDTENSYYGLRQLKILTICRLYNGGVIECLCDLIDPHEKNILRGRWEYCFRHLDGKVYFVRLSRPRR